MILNGVISKLPKPYKQVIFAFVLIANIGFFTGLLFVEDTSHFEPKGIQEQYLGNENNSKATEMIFKKPKKEMLTLIHNHLLSLSVLFLAMSTLLGMTCVNVKLKSFLMIEPFVSLLLTFGGLYVVWSGVLWFSYVVMLSGLLMTLSFLSASVLIIASLFKKA
jgi:hypothetical protein